MLGTHRRKNGFRHQERRGEVDLDRFAPFLNTKIRKPGRQRKCRVVHENVDPSKTFDRALHNVVGDAFHCEITRHRECALTDFLRQRLSAFKIADIHGDRSSALVQTRRGRPSKAAPGTGDYRDAPGKISVFHWEKSLNYGGGAGGGGGGVGTT